MAWWAKGPRGLQYWAASKEEPPASATTQFCAGEPSDAGLAAAYNWSFDGVGVRAADEMCDKMRVRIHETAEPCDGSSRPS